jgi:hypothetical protein
MHNRHFVKLVIIIMLFCSSVFSQKNEEWWSNLTKQYSNQDYNKSKVEFNYNNSRIRIVQVVPQMDKPNLRSIFMCRAWCTITIGKNEVYHDSSDIEPLGSVGGWIIDTGIINADFIILNKIGNYDSRSVILKQNGKIKEFPGGMYFWDEQTELLYLTYESDLPGVTVVNTKNLTQLYQKIDHSEEMYIYGWYFLNGNYGFSCTELHSQIENKETIFLFNLTKKTFKPFALNKENVTNLKRIEVRLFASQDSCKQSVVSFWPCNNKNIK